VSSRPDYLALALLGLSLCALAGALHLLSENSHAAALYWVVAGGLALERARGRERFRAPR
jgi:hypothetical protein